MPSFGMLRCLVLVRTDVSEEYIASIIRATKIDELGTTLAVTSNRRPLRIIIIIIIIIIVIIYNILFSNSDVLFL
jgi:hypothetical protein